VTGVAVRRQAALAAVAILALVAALAVAAVDRRSGGGEGAAVTVSQAGEWYAARAAPYAFDEGARQTACGIPIGRGTLGVAHPVLPCGVKLVVEYDGTRVLTQVIDRGPRVPGREFDVSRPLAERLGLRGVQPIRWAYAR
jgi:rare lipoprotein A (peptidoglycan hydrolase)